jgi:hypothetical protein
MTDRSVPSGYEWPGMDTDGTHYYLSEQADWDGATPLFMVHKQWNGGQTIIAERCYRTYGVEIVDALRQAVAETGGGWHEDDHRNRELGL